MTELKLLLAYKVRARFHSTAVTGNIVADTVRFGIMICEQFGYPNNLYYDEIGPYINCKLRSRPTSRR